MFAGPLSISHLATDDRRSFLEVDCDVIRSSSVGAQMSEVLVMKQADCDFEPSLQLI